MILKADRFLNCQLNVDNFSNVTKTILYLFTFIIIFITSIRKKNIYNKPLQLFTVKYNMVESEQISR